MSAQAFGTACNSPQVDEAAEMMAFDQRWNLWRSAAGTPNISAIMVVGNGKA